LSTKILLNVGDRLDNESPSEVTEDDHALASKRPSDEMIPAIPKEAL